MTKEELWAVSETKEPITRKMLGIESPSTNEGMVELNEGYNIFNKKYKKNISYMVKFIDGSAVHITYDDFQHYTAQLNSAKDNKLIDCADSDLYINPNNVTMIVKEIK